MLKNMMTAVLLTGTLMLTLSASKAPYVAAGSEALAAEGPKVPHPSPQGCEPRECKTAADCCSQSDCLGGMCHSRN